MILDFFDDSPVRARIGKAEKAPLYKYQNGRCNYCGVKLEMAYLEIDHKTPVARYGSNRFSNFQLLCGPCNKRKGDMTDGEFRRAYKLTPSRQVDGPPNRVIPQKYFEGISKTIAAKKANYRRRAAETWW
jgi:hypothetical protein